VVSAAVAGAAGNDAAASAAMTTRRTWPTALKVLKALKAR